MNTSIHGKDLKKEAILSIDKYDSDLNNFKLRKEDYVHSNNVWSTFKIKNLSEYHDLYVQSDTLQLSDVFEDFRKTCLEIYELDPAGFISVPSLAWQACLKITKNNFRTVN